jgi:hypothetical protein
MFKKIDASQVAEEKGLPPLPAEAVEAAKDAGV